MGDLNIYQKLLAIQARLKAPKTQYNKFGDFYYRSLEDILEAAKPLLVKNNLTLILSDEPVVVGDRFYIKATAVLMDAEKPDDSIKATSYAREAETKKKMDDSQVTVATSSYARKNCLNGLFAIDDTKDADSDKRMQGEPAASLMTKAQIEKVKSLARDWYPEKCGLEEIKAVANALGVSARTTTATEFETIWKAAFESQFKDALNTLGLNK